MTLSLSMIVLFRKKFCKIFLIYFPLLTLLWAGNAVKGEENILKWTPPKELIQKFPYLLSGYDKDGSPVWLSQFGQLDVRGTIEEGGKSVRDLDKYVLQCMTRLANSKLFSHPNKQPQNGFVGIVDLEGYSSRQLYHYETVQKELSYASLFVDTLEETGGEVKKIYLVNANWLFRIFWALVRPILGSRVDNFELYGTDRRQWQSALLTTVDRDQLPNWLGGPDDHELVRVYGK